MTPRRSAVALGAVAVALLLANFLFTAHYVNSTQAAARQAGEQVERKLCTSFARLAELKPPPGNPATNPSRAYLQEQHARLDELGTDLGCPIGGTR